MKIAVLAEQDAKANEWLEQATSRMHAHDGAKQALRVVAGNISGLSKIVDADLEAANLPKDPMEVAKYAKTMIDRALHIAATAAQHQESCQLAATGEIAAYRAMSTMARKETANERLKLTALDNAANPDPEAFPPSLLNQRAVEDRKGKKRGRNA